VRISAVVPWGSPSVAAPLQALRHCPTPTTCALHEAARGICSKNLAQEVRKTCFRFHDNDQKPKGSSLRLRLESLYFHSAWHGGDTPTPMGGRPHPGLGARGTGERHYFFGFPTVGLRAAAMRAPIAAWRRAAACADERGGAGASRPAGFDRWDTGPAGSRSDIVHGYSLSVGSGCP